MRILAIETSCDETGLAIIDVQGKKQETRNKDTNINVVANLVRSQVELHKPYGGVVPTIAKREHERALPLLWEEVKNILVDPSSTPDVLPSPDAGSESSSTSGVFPGSFGIDLVAVTQGPGLSPCLWQGIEFAKKLAGEMGVPLVGVNHLKGHVYAAFPWSTSSTPDVFPSAKTSSSSTSGVLPAYPVLSLIVSGGHTELIWSKKLGEFEIVGATRDDAAGEAFDKTARLLGLGYPGGPAISRLAGPPDGGGNPEAFDLPRPMIDADNYDFSFSGLKTAITYRVKGVPPYDTPLELDEQTKKDLAASFQRAVVDVLVTKTIKAAKEYTPKTIILGGGVAANQLLRKELGEAVKQNIPDSLFLVPDSSLATDNALMIALAAWYERNQLQPVKDLAAEPNLKISE